jgi:hypothetical protein
VLIRSTDLGSLESCGLTQELQQLKLEAMHGLDLFLSALLDILQFSPVADEKRSNGTSSPLTKSPLSQWNEITEKTGKRPGVEKQHWWSYEKLKRLGGYLGTCILMTLYMFGPFDKTSQWIKVSGVPKSTFYFLKHELVRSGLVTADGKETTENGNRICRLIESLDYPIVSRAKFYENVDSFRVKR